MSRNASKCLKAKGNIHYQSFIEAPSSKLEAVTRDNDYRFAIPSWLELKRMKKSAKLEQQETDRNKYK